MSISRLLLHLTYFQLNSEIKTGVIKLKVFKKNPQYLKIPGVGIWNGSKAARKKNVGNLIQVIYYTLFDLHTDGLVNIIMLFKCWLNAEKYFVLYLMLRITPCAQVRGGRPA